MDENNNASIPAPEPGEPEPVFTPDDAAPEVAVPVAPEAAPVAPEAAVPEAAPANPFAAYQAAQAPAAEPSAASAPEPYAAAPAQPYAAAPASYAAASQPYQQPVYGYEQPYGYGQGAGAPYGAGQQPPVPPVPPAPVYGWEPPAAGGQKRRWPWFLLGLAVGLVIGMGGCASCVGIMAAASYTDDYASNYDDSYPYDDYHTWPPENDYYTPDDADGEGATTLALTYDEVASLLEADGLEHGTAGADDVCARGYYTVGPEGDIPAGFYYLEGGDLLSRYYVFDASGAGKSVSYDLDDSVQYLGNYFTELDEGDIIAFNPGPEGASMRPAPATSLDPTPPYTNGCYRVGIDIPAGTYAITAAPADDPAISDEDECAAYVMDDLDFDDDSIVDTQYVIPGGTQTVTVTDGQYLELFAATATPSAQE